MSLKIVFRFVLLVVASLSAFGQKATVISEAKGDLNKDKIEDHIRVFRDTSSVTSKSRIEIKFGDKTVFETQDAIPVYDKDVSKKPATNDDFSKVEIDKGVAIFRFEMTRGNYAYKFRWQHGAFKLIGFSFVNSDGRSEIHSIDYSLTTGNHVEKVENYETGKVLSEEKRNVKILLPVLGVFEMDGTDPATFKI